MSDETPVSEHASSGAARNERGHFLPGHAVGQETRWGVGNTAALTTGLRSGRAATGLLPGQEGIVALIAEKRTAIETDLGSDLSTLAGDEVTRYLRLTILAETLWSSIAEAGALTVKGRKRAALTAYLQVNDRIDRVVGRLGLTRKARPANFADAVRAAGAGVE
jgi:hypothetical protein